MIPVMIPVIHFAFANSDDINKKTYYFTSINSLLKCGIRQISASLVKSFTTSEPKNPADKQKVIQKYLIDQQRLEV
ncbi:hypothetical protein BH10ACI1_BH10ACI1_11840 [soil metagenome]